jgi:hypothetical protein
LEGLDDMLLPGHVGEFLRAIFAVKGDIRHGGDYTSPPGRTAGLESEEG